MYKAVDFFQDSIKAHVAAIDDLEHEDGDDAAAEVEARLLTIALLLRLMDKHGYIKKDGMTVPSIGGPEIPAGLLWDAMIHQKMMKTDRKARIDEGITVETHWNKRYRFLLADFLESVLKAC